MATIDFTDALNDALAKRMYWQGPSNEEKYIAECICYEHNEPVGWLYAYDFFQIPKIVWREGFKFRSEKAKKLYKEWLQEQLAVVK